MADLFSTTSDADDSQDSLQDNLDESINSDGVDDTEPGDQDNNANDENNDEQDDNNEQNDTQANPAEREGKPNKQRKDRYEYWQSQATQFQTQLKQYETFAPIVRYLQDNPQVITALESHLVGNAQGHGVAEPKEVQTPKEEELTEPTRPGKPKDYDPYDSDPNSESFKYREALDQYYIDKDTYRDKLLNKTITPYQKAIEDQQAQQKVSQQEQATVQFLMQSRGWDTKKATEFLQYAKEPKNMRDLPEFYEWKLAKGNGKDAKVQPKAKQNQAPSPIGAQPGHKGAPSDASKNFQQQLGATYKDVFRTSRK